MTPLARAAAAARHVAAPLAPGAFVLTGPLLCRPTTCYKVGAARDGTLTLTVVYCAAHPPAVGQSLALPHDRLATWQRLGDVRIVARWQPPPDDIYRALERHMPGVGR